MNPYATYNTDYLIRIVTQSGVKRKAAGGDGPVEDSCYFNGKLYHKYRINPNNGFSNTKDFCEYFKRCDANYERYKLTC